MRTRGLIAAVSFAFALTLVGVGCGETTPPADNPQNPVASDSAPMPPPPASSAAAVDTTPPPPVDTTPPPPPKKKAKEIVTVGSTFMFSFDDSSDAKKAKDDECTKKAGKKADKKDACMKDAADAASKEGVRFVKGDTDKDKDTVYFVSFGQDKKGKEVIYSKVPVTQDKDSDDAISFNITGKDTGKKPMPKDVKSLPFSVPDEKTIVITDAKKGKLVYHKS